MRSRSGQAALVPLLAALHLAVLATGIFVASIHLSGWARTTGDLYQTFTGAGGGWGFFSPDIGNQILVEFEIDGGRRVLLHELVTPEVALRLGNMYRLFAQAYPNEKMKRSIAASLTAQIFRRFPNVAKATMIVSVYNFPSLSEYRSGQRQKTKEVYRISFVVGSSSAG